MNMEIKFTPNFGTNLAYSYLRSQGVLFNVNNIISKKIDDFNKIHQRDIKKQKITFHHTKLASRMLLAKSEDDFGIIENINKSDKFNISLCEYIMPFVLEYNNSTLFKRFYLKEIFPLEFDKIKEKKDFVIEGIKAANKIWKIQPRPKEITIINSCLRDGGHLDIIGDDENIFVSINFFTPYDNMIRYLATHEFSHYFQNKIFDKLSDEINRKEYLFSRKNEDYGEWKSWLAENIIEAIIFKIIRPPPKDKYDKAFSLLIQKYDLVEKIISSIEKCQFKKIGIKEVKTIINSL